jgi:hypothetical protein
MLLSGYATTLGLGHAPLFFSLETRSLVLGKALCCAWKHTSLNSALDWSVNVKYHPFCIGGVVGGTCYSTLAAAVQECPDGATVTVGGTVTVNAPIYFEKNVR